MMENDIPTDRIFLAIASTLMWAFQPQMSIFPYRAGQWPRMDGNRYSNQPDIGLNAFKKNAVD